MACPGRPGGQRSKKKFRVDRTSGIKGREAGDKAEQGGGRGEEMHSYLGGSVLRGATPPGLNHQITLDPAGK